MASSVAFKLVHVATTIGALPGESLRKFFRFDNAPAKILLNADRNIIKADGKDLSFVTITVVDKDGNMVPDAANLIKFSISGNGFIAGTDNGLQTDLTSFKSNEREAFNGLALAVVQSNGKTGNIKLTATTDGMPSASVNVNAK